MDAEDLIRYAARVVGCGVADLVGRSRRHELVLARTAVVVRLMREGLTPGEAAKAVNRDRSEAYHMRQTITDMEEIPQAFHKEDLQIWTK